MIAEEKTKMAGIYFLRLFVCLASMSFVCLAMSSRKQKLNIPKLAILLNQSRRRRVFLLLDFLKCALNGSHILQNLPLNVQPCFVFLLNFTASLRHHRPPCQK